MKLKDIQVGRTYVVKVPEDEDAGAYWDRVYGRRRVYAEALEVGVTHTVYERHSLGGISGTPRVISGAHESERADYVRMRLTNGGRTVTIACRNVEHLKWEEA